MNQPLYDADVCVMTRFSALVSGKWKPIILYLIENDINRFSLMLAHMPKVSRKVLTDQFKQLEADGLISREELKTKEPKIVVYSLTDKGVSLRKLLGNIIEWSLSFEGETFRELYNDFLNMMPSSAKSLPCMLEEDEVKA